jgi:hypothetical protein
MDRLPTGAAVANEPRQRNARQASGAGIERLAIALISAIATLRSSSRQTFIRDLDVPDEIADDFDSVGSSVRKFYAGECFLYQD